MSPQQQQTPSDSRGLATQPLGVIGRLIKLGSNVSVAETVQRELSAINHCQKLGVGLGKGVQGSMAPTIAPHRLTDRHGFLSQRGGNMDRCQRGQIALSRCMTHLCSPIQIGHAAPQNAPLIFARRVVLRTTPYSKVLGFVNGGFGPEDTAFIVTLNGIFVQPVLDPHPIRPSPSISLHLVVKMGSSGSAHETQHLFAAKSHHRVMHQRGINPRQCRPIAKHHVGSVLRLRRRPVIVAPDGTGDLLVQGMAQLDQRVHQLGPVRFVLFFQQSLGACGISHPAKTVILAAVSHPRSIHLTRQPLSTVNTDLHQEGEPRLQSNAQPTQLLVNQIKVEVDTFTPLQFKFQLLGLTITAGTPVSTGLDTTQHSNKSRTHARALFNLQSNLFLARPAGRQVNHRAAMFLGQGRTRLADTVGKANRKGLKVLPKHTGPLEIILHDRRIIETSQRPLKPKPVPSVQYADDIGLMALYKWMWDVVRFRSESFLHNSLLHAGRCPVIFSSPISKTLTIYSLLWLRLCRARFSAVKFYPIPLDREELRKAQKNEIICRALQLLCLTLRSE